MRREGQCLVMAFPDWIPSDVTVISAVGFPKYFVSLKIKAIFPLRWFEVAF